MSLDTAALSQIANAMVAPGKGILAADESSGTIKKRFDSISVESNEANRQTYRQMLFTTAGMADHISGVILFDETIRQSTDDGVPFPKYLADLGVIPGIKVDTGAKPLAGSPGETVTEGLDGLRERLAEYHALGARFAKWRATYSITDDLPSENCYRVNAHALARYAALCQEAGIVPIVEPEVLMDGTHSIDRAAEVTARAQQELFDELFRQCVYLPGTILKPNMVLSGYSAATQAPDEEIAAKTLGVFKATVPAAIPGIVFLSGGQSDEDATARLNLMNTMGPLPWALSFSYGRALQAPALKAWGGQAGNLGAGQAAFAKRARLNGLAAKGEYAASMESAA